MGIKAKKSAILRFTGSILILIGLMISLIFRILFLDNTIGSIIWILLNLPWIMVSFLLKLSIDFVSNNSKKILLFLIIYSSLILLVLIMWNVLIAATVVFNFILSLLSLTSWYFCLSLYKKRKIVFLLSGIFYVSGSIFLNLKNDFLGTILSICIVGLGIVLILIIEFNLRKKGYMNYI
ncbi:MAG: hypothetical protein EU532_14795 [Promethearchaeota archaeon]|nr:MAG: hypothetical protein EU532_14795 [Candidatus Lokiarchaeota archaeon]